MHNVISEIGLLAGRNRGLEMQPGTESGGSWQSCGDRGRVSAISGELIVPVWYLVGLQGIKTMCLFPADIPLVSESEFQQIAIDHASHQGLTIVPSHDFKGTNCMLLSPPNILPFCFGIDSYAEHIRQGIKLNLSCQSKHFHGIALDIDNPNDLKTLVVATQKTQSISYLKKIKIGLRFN